MSIVEDIKQAWSWVGIEPIKVVAENDFGNLIIEDRTGKYWRLCPEEVHCKVVADDETALRDLFQDEEFLMDWSMDRLVQLAQDKLGPLKPGYKYYLVYPAILGGAYDLSNINTVSLTELIRFSGDVGEQIKDLPDGAQVQIKIVD